MSKQNLFESNLIAHRGLHDGDIPENSLNAFKEAINNNYIIELDVHLTQDNYVVVFHDDNLKRMIGIDKQIKNCTKKELKEYYLNNSKEKIPTLEEVLTLVNGQVPILLELKTDLKVGKLEKEVLKVIKNYKGSIYFQSFGLRNCLFVKRKKYKVGLLIRSKKSKLYYFLIYMFIRIFKIDFISVPISELSNKYIKKLSYKKITLVWTVRNEKNYNLVKNKVDGIIFEHLPSCMIDKKVI